MQTSRFGEISIDENLIFTFVEPILGYDEYSKYILIEYEENSVFKWLQCIEDPDLALPVASPAMFKIDYQFEIPDEKAEKLDLTSAESVISLNVVTIPNNNPQLSTINLVAPIVINANNRLALQLILPDSSDYEVRHRLFTGKPEPETVLVTETELD